MGLLANGYRSLCDRCSGCRARQTAPEWATSDNAEPLRWDIGDYLKLSILRNLSSGYRLGVAWWLFPDEAHNGDGRHVGYLNRPDQWRHFEPEVFDALHRVVSSGDRNVRTLQASHLIPGATYADDVIPNSGPIAQRLSARRAWLVGVHGHSNKSTFCFSILIMD